MLLTYHARIMEHSIVNSDEEKHSVAQCQTVLSCQEE